MFRAQCRELKWYSSLRHDQRSFRDLICSDHANCRGRILQGGFTLGCRDNDFLQFGVLFLSNRRRNRPEESGQDQDCQFGREMGIASWKIELILKNHAGPSDIGQFPYVGNLLFFMINTRGPVAVARNANGPHNKNLMTATDLTVQEIRSPVGLSEC